MQIMCFPSDRNLTIKRRIAGLVDHSLQEFHQGRLASCIHDCGEKDVSVQ